MLFTFCCGALPNLGQSHFFLNKPQPLINIKNENDTNRTAARLLTHTEDDEKPKDLLLLDALLNDI